MRKAVSISLGSSERDKEVTVVLNGVEVNIHRMGTDGDVAKARTMVHRIGRQSRLSERGRSGSVPSSGRS